MRGATAVAPVVQATLYFRAAVPGRGTEKRERVVVPDRFEWIVQNITKLEFLFPEEEIAGIDGPVRQDAELCGSRGTAHLRKLGIACAVRDETRTEDRTNPWMIEPLIHDSHEPVKRNGLVKIIPVH